MMFSGFQIEVVAPGTVIAKDAYGNDMIVTDNSAVFNGPKVWVTQKIYDALKAKTAFNSTPAWNGPGENPHAYSPDYMAMGDCRICGHTRAAHEGK